MLTQRWLCGSPLRTIWNDSLGLEVVSWDTSLFLLAVDDYWPCWLLLSDIIIGGGKQWFDWFLIWLSYKFCWDRSLLEYFFYCFGIDVCTVWCDCFAVGPEPEQPLSPEGDCGGGAQHKLGGHWRPGGRQERAAGARTGNQCSISSIVNWTAHDILRM